MRNGTGLPFNVQDPACAMEQVSVTIGQCMILHTSESEKASNELSLCDSKQCMVLACLRVQ